jgi:hypothetical protein
MLFEKMHKLPCNIVKIPDKNYPYFVCAALPANNLIHNLFTSRKEQE